MRSHEMGHIMESGHGGRALSEFKLLNFERDMFFLFKGENLDPVVRAMWPAYACNTRDASPHLLVAVRATPLFEVAEAPRRVRSRASWRSCAPGSWEHFYRAITHQRDAKATILVAKTHHDCLF